MIERTGRKERRKGNKTQGKLKGFKGGVCRTIIYRIRNLIQMASHAVGQRSLDFLILTFDILTQKLVRHMT